MPRLFAFLRAINAGPGRTVRMNVLRKAFESLGFGKVATFLGSGNVVFETRTKHVGALERKIERALQEALGYKVPVFIRTQAALKEISSMKLFEDPETRGADLNVILLANNLSRRSKAKLLALKTETDGFWVRGREIYWWRRKKPDTSLFATLPSREGTPRAVYHSQHEHDSKTSREVAVVQWHRWPRIRRIWRSTRQADWRNLSSCPRDYSVGLTGPTTACIGIEFRKWIVQQRPTYSPRWPRNSN